MSVEVLTVMLVLNGLRFEVAESLALKLSWVPSYGLVEALSDYPWLANADYESARSLIRDYREQQRRGGEEK
jgi:hypothetical protein